MKKFLVLKSELATSGRGVNGRTLYKFLETFVGPNEVDGCSLAELLAGRGLSAEYVFLGLPASVTTRHLAKLRYRHLILYDLTDNHCLMWDETNRELLKDLTPYYFKAWIDDRWRFGVQMGLLPIRRYQKLRLALTANQVKRALGCARGARQHDVMFLGALTGTESADPATGVYNQRVEWLQELQRNGRHLQFWGGFIDRGEAIPAELAARYGDFTQLIIRGRVSFWKYFRELQLSRVALTPQGHAPWSYRHYEAIYAGAAIVTNDLQHIRTLIPLPLDNLVQVRAHEPVLPAIERALRMAHHQPEIREENLLFLEQFLDRGMYSPRRPELFQRFVAQLPTSLSPGQVHQLERGLN